MWVIISFFAMIAVIAVAACAAAAIQCYVECKYGKEKEEKE